jgi:hypothetical protein
VRYRSLDDVARLVGARLGDLAPNPVVVARVVGIAAVGGTPVVLVDVGWERRAATFAVRREVRLGHWCYAVRRDGRLTAPWDVIATNYRIGPAFYAPGSGLGQGPLPPGASYLPGDPGGTGLVSPTDPAVAWDSGTYPDGFPMALGLGVVP